MIQTTPFTFEDFSGGITDNFVDCPINKYEKAENFVITENRKLEPIYGAELYDSAKPQLPTGNQRVGTIIRFYDEYLFQANKKVYEDDTTWVELTGPTGNGSFSLGDANSVVSYATWNNHLFMTNDEYSPTMKVYRDAAGDIQLRSAGLPALASNPSIAGGAGTLSYIYAFVYYYTYNVGTVAFEDFGPVLQIQKTALLEPSATTVNITSIPTLANGSTYNWDTTNVKIKIYRTVAGGETLYEIGQVNNGVTTYNDSDDDDDIQTNTVLYIDGGVLDNDEPPLAKTIHVANGACWYGNIKTGTEIISNRVYQSIIDDPDSVPASAYVDLEDEVVAISSYLDRVIVLCKRSVYRLDGSFDELGGGSVTYQRIADTYGCVSGNSVVQIPNGIVFAAEEGFCYTDGFTTMKISGGFDRTYRNLIQTANQKKRIYGAYDRVNGRVWWSVQRGQGVDDDIDYCYILDTRFGIDADSSFTTAGNMDSFTPTAITFDKGDLIRGDTRGYVLKHGYDLINIPIIDTAKSPANWGYEAILYDFISMATSFGNDKFRKFVPRVILRARNISNISLQIRSLTDLGTRERDLPVIRWRGNFVWGDPLFEWGANYFLWGDPGLIEEMRRFHGDDLRSTFRQLQLKNSYNIILESDSLDTADLDGALNTVAINNPGTNDWPEDLIGYQIFFESDNYVQGYDIYTQSADTLTVLDPSGVLPTANAVKWIIKGYTKSEALDLINLTMEYAMLGQTQSDYNTSNVGGNA